MCVSKIKEFISNIVSMTFCIWFCPKFFLFFGGTYWFLSHLIRFYFCLAYFLSILSSLNHHVQIDICHRDRNPSDREDLGRSCPKGVKYDCKEIAFWDMCLTIQIQDPSSYRCKPIPHRISNFTPAISFVKDQCKSNVLHWC